MNFYKIPIKMLGPPGLEGSAAGEIFFKIRDSVREYAYENICILLDILRQPSIKRRRRKVF